MVARTHKPDEDTDQKPDPEAITNAAPSEDGEAAGVKVKMVKVRTTGNHLFHDVYSGFTVDPDEDKEIPLTQFAQQKLDDKTIELA